MFPGREASWGLIISTIFFVSIFLIVYLVESQTTNHMEEPVRTTITGNIDVYEFNYSGYHYTCVVYTSTGDGISCFREKLKEVEE